MKPSLKRRADPHAVTTPLLGVFAVCMAHLIAVMLLVTLLAKPYFTGLTFYGPIVEVPRFRNSDQSSQMFYAPPASNSTCKPILISIDRQQRLFLPQETIDLAGLRHRLPGLLESLNEDSPISPGHAKTWVQLNVDRRVPFGRVMEVARILRDLRVDRLNLVIRGEREAPLHECE